nr:SHOCT domain-containing protein [Pseudaminobacter soli]
MSLMGYRVLRLHTSHDELAFKTIESKSAFDQVVSIIESLRHPPSIDPALKKDGSVSDKLKQLAELYDAGILTEQEFITKKAELLARL